MENPIELPVVVNKYKVNMKDADVIYIGRGSIWGNPYPMYNESERESVIHGYRLYLWKQIQSGKIDRPMLLSLCNCRIACFCAPKACHGDVIVAAVKWCIENIYQNPLTNTEHLRYYSLIQERLITRG